MTKAYVFPDRCALPVGSLAEARASWLAVGSMKLTNGERARARRVIMEALREFKAETPDFQFSLNLDNEPVELLRMPVLVLGSFHIRENQPPTEITEKIFNDLIANLEAGVIGFQPYLHTGHFVDGKIDTQAAEGWIVMFERGTGTEEFEDNDPNTLYAYIEPRSPETAQKVKDKVFTKCSIEFFENFLDRRDGKRKGATAQAIAFTNAPFIPDMGDAEVISFSSTSNRADNSDQGLLTVAYNNLDGADTIVAQEEETGIVQVNTATPATEQAAPIAATETGTTVAVELAAPAVEQIAEKTEAELIAEAEAKAAEEAAAEAAEAEAAVAANPEAAAKVAEAEAAAVAAAQAAMANAAPPAASGDEFEAKVVSQAAAAGIEFKDGPEAKTDIVISQGVAGALPALPSDTPPAGFVPAAPAAVKPPVTSAAPQAAVAAAPTTPAAPAVDANAMLAQMQAQLDQMRVEMQASQKREAEMQMQLVQFSSSVADPYVALEAQHISQGVPPALVRNVMSLARMKDGVVQLSSGAQVDPLEAAKAVLEAFPAENRIELAQQNGVSALNQFSNQANQSGGRQPYSHVISGLTNTNQQAK